MSEALSIGCVELFDTARSCAAQADRAAGVSCAVVV
jgi:hypothetical protein